MANSLLDTNVLSQPLKPKPHEEALRWMIAAPRESTFLSVITIQETRTGLDLLKESEKKQRLEAWFRRVRRRYAGRILPVSEEVAEVAGKFHAELRKRRITVEPNDVLLAATAKVHHLQIASINRIDFEKLPVTLIRF